MNPSKQALLKVENVHFSVEQADILKGIDFTIKKGSITGIIGTNGCGKTTLFNILSGFHAPSKGNIYFNQKNITKVPIHKRAILGIGRVFQNFGIFGEMTLRENIIIALENRDGTKFLESFPWSKKYKKHIQEAEKLLEEIHLLAKKDQKANSLSGGQKRLLEIIRTFALGAELFLLDEPTAGVAPKMKNGVLELLKKMKNKEKTILIVEHDINFIGNICDEIIVMDQGKIILQDTPENIQNNTKVREIYFGIQ
jgi:branched-chain amino acid transport system ATP-binding protein